MVTWLRTNKVLLPGVTTPGRLVARVRDEATDRLYNTLYGIPSPRQRVIPQMLLEVPVGRRASDLERWRKSPAATSGKNLEKALERAAEILGVGLGAMPLPPEVPHRRMVDLARYGMQATASTLRRHGPSRQLAEAVAAVTEMVPPPDVDPALVTGFERLDAAYAAAAEQEHVDCR
ncbi:MULTISPECIES: hypothetical protein [unclassified Nonomuraea]|uniref:hypothetical protein n=1 Tax=unclassified Nonomuraea TaxID=2593643 RepID=UPI00340FD160